MQDENLKWSLNSSLHNKKSICHLAAPRRSRQAARHQRGSLRVQWRGCCAEQSPGREGPAVRRTRPPAPLLHFLLRKGRASAAPQEELCGCGAVPRRPRSWGRGLCKPRPTSSSDHAARQVSTHPPAPLLRPGMTTFTQKRGLQPAEPRALSPVRAGPGARSWRGGTTAAGSQAP